MFAGRGGVWKKAARRTAAAVDEGEGLGVLVGDELHLELGGVAGAEDLAVGEREEAHLVERLRAHEGAAATV